VAHLKKLPKYPLVYDQNTYHQDTELVYELMSISDVGFVFQVLSFTRRHEKAHTTTEGQRYKTLFQLKEKILWEYKGEDPVLNRMYKDVRQEYAYFLLSRRFRGDTKTINWHKNYIVRDFKTSEYILGALYNNKLFIILSKFLSKSFKSI
jgi:hypothetical protein